MGKIRIYIKDLKGREVALEVNSSDTIDYAKKKYSSLINSIPDYWTFNGMILNDDKTFDFYDIIDDDRIISQMSNISYKPKLRINIKDLKGKSVQLEVHSSDRIGYAKRLYANLVHLSNNYCMWKFDGVVLNDDKTFEYYGIEEGDNIISNDRLLG